MSSRHHTPGISQSPRDIGNRGLRGILGHQQQRTADIREALYIKPLGRQQHLVRNLGDNAKAYRVGSNLPGLTFKPGEVVQLSSNTGHPGENIISVAPPGKKGAMPGFQGSGSVTFGAPEECPTASTGHSYIAIYADTTNDLLYAYNYTDGAQGSQIGNAYDYSSDGWTDDDVYLAEPVLIDTNTVAMRVARRKLAIWDIVDESVTTIDRTNPGGDRGSVAFQLVGFPLAEMGATGSFYWVESVGPSGSFPEVHFWLMKWNGSVLDLTSDVDAETDSTAAVVGWLFDGTSVLIPADSTSVNRGYVQIPTSTAVPGDYVLDTEFLPEIYFDEDFTAGQPVTGSRAAAHFTGGPPGAILRVGLDGWSYLNRCGVHGGQNILTRPNLAGTQVATYDHTTAPPTILRMTVEERTGSSGAWAGTAVSQISGLSVYPTWMLPND